MTAYQMLRKPPMPVPSAAHARMEAPSPFRLRPAKTSHTGHDLYRTLMKHHDAAAKSARGT